MSTTASGWTAKVVMYDAGTGAWDYDITAYVKNFTFTNGRQDEASQSDVGTASIVVDNTDGRFTMLSPIGGPYNFQLGQGVAIQAVDPSSNVYPLYVGTVDTAPLTWSDNSGYASQVSINLVDAWSKWQAYILGNAYYEQVFIDPPAAYWPMSDSPQNGATFCQAGDTSGLGQSSLARRKRVSNIVAGEGSGDNAGLGFESDTYYYFPNGASATTASASVGLQSGSNGSTGLLPGPNGNPFNSAYGVTMSCWVRVNTINAGTVRLLTLVNPGNDFLGIQLINDTVYVAFETAAFGGATTISSTGYTIGGGAWYQLGVSNNGSTVTVYVNGVNVYSESTSGFPSATAPCYVDIGDGLVGDMMGVAVWDKVLTDSQMNNIAYYGINGFGNNPFETVISSLASYVGNGASVARDTFGTIPIPSINVGGMPTAGQSAYALAQSVAMAAGALVWASTHVQGQISYQNKNDVVNFSTTSYMTLQSGETDTGDPVENDLTFANDRQYLFNDITATDAIGVAQQVTDKPSIAQYGDLPFDLSAPWPDDVSALSAMQWFLAKHKNFYPGRVSTATVDFGSANATTVFQIIGAGGMQGRGLTIADLPANAPYPGGVAVNVQGTSMTWDAQSGWTATYNTAPAGLNYGWKLDDTTYSVLGTSTVLYF